MKFAYAKKKNETKDFRLPINIKSAVSCTYCAKRQFFHNGVALGTKKCYIVDMATRASRIRNILTLWGRSKVASPAVTGSASKVLRRYVNEEAMNEKAMANMLAKARKSPFARELFDQISQAGGGPEISAMTARDLTKGNLGSEELTPSKTGYVFKANADACPRCLMFDGTWIANPIDAQLLSHPGCRCSVVPRADYTSYEKDYKIDLDTAAQNNKSFGHSEELTPWVYLKNQGSLWGLDRTKESDYE